MSIRRTVADLLQQSVGWHSKAWARSRMTMPCSGRRRAGLSGLLPGGCSHTDPGGGARPVHAGCPRATAEGSRGQTALEALMTGLLTSYKHRTNHELAKD